MGKAMGICLLRYGAGDGVFMSSLKTPEYDNCSAGAVVEYVQVKPDEVHLPHDGLDSSHCSH